MRQRSDVSHVYIDRSGYTLSPSGVVVRTSALPMQKQVLRSVVPPILQILPTGSVHSQLPSFNKQLSLSFQSGFGANAQGSLVQVRPKSTCALFMASKWWSRFGFIDFLVGCLLHNAAAFTQRWRSEAPCPKSSPKFLMSVYSELVRFEANVYFFQPAGYARHLRPGGSTADPHHELGPACRDHRHLH